MTEAAASVNETAVDMLRIGRRTCENMVLESAMHAGVNANELFQFLKPETIRQLSQIKTSFSVPTTLNRAIDAIGDRHIQWLRDNQWAPVIARHLRYGGKLIGICGGFQMLGTAIDDPDGIEGAPGSAEGLGLLQMQTRLYPEKQLRRVEGTLALCSAGGSA